MAHGLTNGALIPSHELEWKGGIRPEESDAARRVRAGRDLSSLLAEIEDPHKLTYETIIDVLYKNDPVAIEPLIKLFADPDSMLTGLVATAIACIGGTRQKSEQVTAETFARLRGLLNDKNPIVRGTSAQAIGEIGGEEAGKELTTLLSDPDASVRETALFQIGQLGYTPAMEAIRVLTRDVDRSVRKEARTLLKELTAIAQCEDKV